MKSIHAAAALAVAALFLGGMAGTAFAADTGSVVNATAGVIGGDRTATLGGDVAFPAVDASHSDVAATDQATSVEVNDLSATDAGWAVTIVSSDLAGPSGTSIPAADVSVDSFGDLTPISGVSTGITTGSTGSIGSAVTLLSAPVTDGVGDYTQAFDLGMVVPADSLAGSYSGTLTVTIAPPS
jgi:hypothetical protein